MENWYLLAHKRCPPAWNMACDEWLLIHATSLARPVLRTYGWDRPSITIGYFQPFPDGIPESTMVIRRPTGGALVHHGSDLTFTVALPGPHPWRKLPICQRYNRIHDRVHHVFRSRGLAAALASPEETASSGRAGGNDLCFAKSSRYDVLVDGTKVAGGAQRVTRDGLLHQGSIQGENLKPVFPNELESSWRTYDTSFEPLKLTAEALASISDLAKRKYATTDWNHRVPRHQET